ncbi:MAG: right-handed parallel beta-helix repeat-containing protein [bacterium]|nr:right-handed parallel beta-helix repeat-containing protein [Candidatus Kapabacteria bacterium]
MLLLIAFGLHPSAAQTVRPVGTVEELRALLSTPIESIDIRLAPGTYHLIPTSHIEETCGNCADSTVDVRYTRGLRVSGRNVRIIGPADRSAELATHSGYGILVEDCKDCTLENLTITSGERDTAVNASDAAVVVRNSSVRIINNRIAGNIGDSTRVVRAVAGIMGIYGREGSDMLIEGNDIMRNSWNGIGLYRSARAMIRGNVIDGVDDSVGTRIGGGRGIGIDLSWNATATVEDNLVRRYWQGIGVFQNANATIRHNVIEDIVARGIFYWDGDSGKPRAAIVENIIYSTGACGASISRSTEGSDPGRFERNLLVGTAQNSKYDSPDAYCYQCALAQHAVPADFVIRDNVYFDNRRADTSLPSFNNSDEVFYRAVREWCTPFAILPVMSRSNFVRRYCSDVGEIESGRP